MPDLRNDNTVKVIPFYLPQFHSIPENDKAWGKGFTEWNNVKKAKPLFKGHNQPRVPLNNNYYNLLDDDVKIWQATIAKQYGIYGFCYYHYWFKNGKKLLEKPAEQMLANKNIDIPFCFSWANENWSRKWDGGNKEIIAEQDYGKKEDWIEHIDYLIPFFKDSRYITYDNRPVFLIYKPELIPHLEDMIKAWNLELKKNGLNKLCLIIQNCGWYFSPFYNPDLFDFQIEFEPFFSMIYKEKNMDKLNKQKNLMRVARKLHLEKGCEFFYKKLKSKKDDLHRGNILVHNNYDQVWNTILNLPTSDFMIKGAFCDWDNTPRNVNGRVFDNVSIDSFSRYFHQEVKLVSSSNNHMIFINAWNEWGEGTYLEPDEKNKYGYLEAIKKEILG